MNRLLALCMDQILGPGDKCVRVITLIDRNTESKQNYVCNDIIFMSLELC